MKEYIKVAAFQGHAINKDPERALNKVLELMKDANANQIDILCMPESYLHGYLKTEEEAKKYSISLESAEFQEMCKKFSSFKTTLLLGLNERQGNELFNTTVVIENGACIGSYRKAFTYPPYDYFKLGNDFSIFTKSGIPYGIVICCDINFLEPSRILALQGAKIIFCPMWNAISKHSKMLSLMNNKSHFMARAIDNRCWIVASDIIIEDAGDDTCPGYANIINPKGELVSKSEPFTENLLVYSIPTSSLYKDHDKHLKGREDLFEKMVDKYRSKFRMPDLIS